MELSKEEIVSLIAQRNEFKKQLLICVDDFEKPKIAGKIAKLNYILSEATKNLDASLKGDEHKNKKKSIDKSTNDSKKEFKIAILTIRRPELTAVQVTQNIEPDKIEDMVVQDFRIWETSLESKRSSEALPAILTMSGIPRNIYSALAACVILNNFDIDLFVLVGMGAGDPKKRSLGDVVAATAVEDTMGGRITSEKLEVRPDGSNVKINLVRTLEDFDSNIYDWYDFLASKVPELAKYKEIPENMPSPWKPRFEVEPIFVSENLRVDDPWKKYQDQYHQQGRTFEMEALGFAKFCDAYGVPWLVFRGISDFATEESKDNQFDDDRKKDNWQPYASLAAATAFVSFVKNSLHV